MKKRLGNCEHGLSLDIRKSDDCCLTCISPKVGDKLSYFEWLAKNQKDLEPEFKKIVDDNFFDLLI